MHDAQGPIHQRVHICRRVASRKQIGFNVVWHGDGHLLHHGDRLQDGVVAQLEGDYGIGDYELEYLRADGPFCAGEEGLQDAVTSPLKTRFRKLV